ncbi:hypothetical protein [Chromobacterium subtsugae]|uniref:hypothetical protein n=1 Tax=Chromobacterium subtsugae TaxID=251747 RepID=UPI0012FF966E|nr:hypothetical protein [Chromobacterium subtsugae]
MKVLLTEQEQAALLSCSLEAFRLYLAGLRPRVDIRTGIVGRGYPISRSVLAIHCQYVPPRGSRRPAWMPSLKQIDALLDELERVGLIKRAATVQEFKKLVLKLPLLVRLGDEQDMSRSAGGGQRDISESQAAQGSEPSLIAVDQDEGGQFEADISENNNKYIHIAREGECCEQSMRLAAAATRLGVRVGGAANPAVLEWVEAGVTLTQLRQAIDRSRGYIAAGKVISAKYLSKVLWSIREEEKPSAARSVSGRPLERKVGRNDPAWKSIPAPDPEKVVPVSGSVVGGDEGDWLD